MDRRYLRSFRPPRLVVGRILTAYTRRADTLRHWLAASTTPRLLLGAWLALEAVFLFLDIWLGPWSVVGFEEGRNARAALQVMCGHTDRLLDLQYRDFCGGCTGVALFGAPVMALLGTSVAAWKAVPALFHIGLGIAMLQALRRAGALGSPLVAAGGLLFATPWALRELALTAWGNHAEVRTLVVAALALLVVPRAERRVLELVLAGILTGLSLWFAHIAAFAVPALLFLSLQTGLRSAGFAFGLGIGTIPYWYFQWNHPTAQAGATELWTTITLAEPIQALRYLGSPLRPQSLWPSTGNAGIDAGLAVSFSLTVIAGILGAIEGTRRRNPLALGLVLAWIGYIAAIVLRADLWADIDLSPGYAPFHLRYRVVLWPLLVLGAAVLVGYRPRLAWILVAPLLVSGTLARAVAWTYGPGPRREMSVWNEPGRPDGTVPEGNPPRRRAWGLDRAVDIDAARTFLDAHTDTEPLCRIDHLGEAGRRAGLMARNGPVPDVGTDTAVVEGIAWGLLGSGASPAPDVISHFPGHLQEPVTTAVLRLATSRGIALSWPPLPGAAHGRCLGLAAQAWLNATDDERHLPFAPPPNAPSGCPNWSENLSETVSRRTTQPVDHGWRP